jgi:hypothetical protein
MGDRMNVDAMVRIVRAGASILIEPGHLEWTPAAIRISVLRDNEPLAYSWLWEPDTDIEARDLTERIWSALDQLADEVNK